jgi:hypothetical protein
MYLHVYIGRITILNRKSEDKPDADIYKIFLRTLHTFSEPPTTAHLRFLFCVTEHVDRSHFM